ncbi:MAG: SCO family protein, partial [Chromatiales bacterium]|nr:SCO family protein [Chromatiales bacterium]
MRKIFPTLLWILLLLMMAGSTTAVAKEDFRVVVSIKPLHSILAGLMEGLEQGPELLVPQGQTPLNYQLTDAQRESIQQADLLFWAGPELEAFLIEPVAGLPASTQVETLLDNSELKILDARWSDQDRDPFFWLDTRNALILIDEMARKLSATDLAHAHLYKRNRKKLLMRMAELDRRFEYGYRGFKGGIGLSYFDTLQYFEQAYALKIGNTITSLQHRQVSGATLLENRAKLHNGEYACLILEADVEAKELPLLANADTPVPTAELDTFGVRFTPGPELYFELMEYNTNTIKACLNPQVEKVAEEVPKEEELFPAYKPIRGKFMLVDQNSRLVTEKDMLGKYQLIQFGYTSCPDICPTSLQVMSIALERLGKEKAALIQPYFISIDPERDTVQLMKEYVRYFDNNLIGLTGSTSMIKRVAEQYRVNYEKVFEEGRDPKLYLMDHT